MGAAASVRKKRRMRATGAVKMRVLAAFMSFALGASAVAEPFWVEYDASCGQFPEEVGWGRLAMSGGAQRSFVDGNLRLDSSAGPGIIDCYGISRPVDLSPGESFVMEWRLRVNEVHGAADPPVKPAITVGFDGYGMVDFAYSEGSLHILDEHLWIDLDPHVFHDYSFTSSDLLTYELRIDGSVAHSGPLTEPCYVSAVGWGDKVTGATSVSDWDCVWFGVVPEPSAALLTISTCLAGIILRAQRTRRSLREDV
jgi:hypothetical protein